jgi:hypothetical protein
MKKLFGISIVILMLALSVVPAFAKGPGPADNGSANGVGLGNQNGSGVQTPYALSGTIAGIDPQARTITITVVAGNRLITPDSNPTVTVQTTPTTRFLLRNPDGTATPITFDDLQVGQTVSSHGIVENGVYIATRVTVGAKLNCIQ